MRSTLVLILSIFLLLASPITQAGDKTGTPEALDTMRDAAIAFVDSLSTELRQQATFSPDDDERRAWSNTPYPMFPREGLSFGEMSPEQRVHAQAMLQSALSSQGYLKAAGIMHLDEILRVVLNLPADSPVQLGHDLYWISMFGNPGEDTVWGWQLDGHHLALNISVVGDAISVRPAFFGSNPAVYPDGTFAGWNILFNENDKGMRLFASLDDQQRAKAIIAEKSPADLITGPGNGDRLKERQGLLASEMTQSQQELLNDLIDEYVGNYRSDIANEQLRRIMEPGLEEMYFAWAGTGEDEPYYYRVHGPTVIIEFTNMYPPNETSGPINHIHTVFREPGNDYGEDLLRKHLEESDHH